MIQNSYDLDVLFSILYYSKQAGTDFSRLYITISITKQPSLVHGMPSSSDSTRTLVYWSTRPFTLIYIQGTAHKKGIAERPVVPTGCAGGIEANLLFLSF